MPLNFLKNGALLSSEGGKKRKRRLFLILPPPSSFARLVFPTSFDCSSAPSCLLACLARTNEREKKGKKKRRLMRVVEGEVCACIEGKGEGCYVSIS